MATKTAVIILCEEAVLIWAIPPLLPQPPDSFDRNSIQMLPPLFTIPFPEISHLPPRIYWKTISSWYFGSSQPLYFDMLCQDSKLHRFQIMLKPDLSAASLHVINISEQTLHDFNHVFFNDYRICEDTLVSSWFYNNLDNWGVYSGSTSARFANAIPEGHPAAKMLFPVNFGPIYLLHCCPASGRLVVMDSTECVSVVDLF